MLGPVLILCLLADAALGNVVDTALGKIEGSARKSRSGRDFYSFTSVPYAKPPLGELRFKSPQPVDKWDGILDATGDESPRCLQIYFFVPALKNLTMGQEDCLYLNVFTPKVDKRAGLPVMVYYHGGGWRCGEAGGHSRAEFFMDEEVVLVVPSYRLGALGFLSTEDEVIPGNFGLKDQAMVLRWVKENIEHFGGNPDSITIFGESAGGASVHYHLMSPLSKDLIKGGISESGTASSLWSAAVPGLARTRARKVAELLGCPTECHREMLDCLRRADGKQITETERDFNVIDFDPAIVFQPVIESSASADAFITTDPLYTETHLPWIQGLTSSEGALKAASLLSGDPNEKERYIDEFEELLPMVMMYEKRCQDDQQLTLKIRQRYFNDRKPTIKDIVDVFSDGLFLWPSGVAASNHKGPQWFYYFDHRGETSMSNVFGVKEDLGVCHGDELFYLFNLSDMIPDSKYSDADRRISEKLVRLWVDFAKYGNPTPGHSEVKWKQHGSQREYLHMMTDHFKMEKNLLEDNYEFWNSLPINRNLKPARDEL